jgi:hypothetical protein
MIVSIGRRGLPPANALRAKILETVDEEVKDENQSCGTV